MTMVMVGCEPNNPSQGNHRGHNFVDLGLSVKWATCNIGATTPEEYGDYFAWGETEPKEIYTWETYKYCDGSKNTLTKYCSVSSDGKDGFVDNKRVLDPEDDAAHVHWGGKWRMPTSEELEELKNNCTMTYTETSKGVFNKFTSNIPGYTNNSIYLPAAGVYFAGRGLESVGTLAIYASSSCSGSENTYILYLYGHPHDLYPWGRYNGYTIRPVCP
jgi:hypothetical protein